MTHLEKFQRKLEGGAALISSPQNQFYLSGFRFDDGYLLIFSDCAYLLTDSRYSEAAEKKVTGFQILTPKKHVEAVAELLASRKITELTVEEKAMTLADKDTFSAKLSGVQIRGGATALLLGLRVKKDAAELDAITRAQALTDAAFSHILTFLRPGVKERDVALELEFFLRKNGADGLAFETIAVSGGASSLPHGVPRDVALEKGFLTMDFGARVDGYCSDMTRTVVIGKADAEMKKLYATVLSAQKTALEAAAAGISCRALDGIARRVIDGNGYAGRFGHSLGHGVGLDIHEAPRLSPTAPEESVLEIGQVVTVEPGIYLPGQYGCRIEDMIFVDGYGKAVDLTKSGKELIEL